MRWLVSGVTVCDGGCVYSLRGCTLWEARPAPPRDRVAERPSALLQHVGTPLVAGRWDRLWVDAASGVMDRFCARRGRRLSGMQGKRVPIVRRQSCLIWPMGARKDWEGKPLNPGLWARRAFMRPATEFALASQWCPGNSGHNSQFRRWPWIGRSLGVGNWQNRGIAGGGPNTGRQRDGGAGAAISGPRRSNGKTNFGGPWPAPARGTMATPPINQTGARKDERWLWCDRCQR